MESTIESLNAAYQDFISAATVVLESRQSSGGEETPATATALESFKQKWELFRVACDQAEELVESVRQRIGSECLVDEATGGGASGAASQGIPPISAVRLEQMSKAVRWLVIDLQHGSGGAAGGVAGGGAGHGGGAHSHGPGPTGFDARFTEDGAQ
ncbi:hypothetical protein LUZ61_006197 [Rhynchospora tenuis]|uniref:Mediator of RNA polymerase II transcription subunit 32 n=1 Tax=Rhynchospora tenuis TaxID=198213 RepID=A0AAD6EVA4_9POAL|nr:hypothetical protein LUZ61_006197 [Rhynchospora tenuis]